jgi:HlyD family secretion protein
MRRWYLIIVGLALLASAFALWFFKKRGVEGLIEASGQVRGTEVTVGSNLPGRVESLKVKEGQAINAGDLIAKISSEEIQARIEQARAQVEASGSRLKEIGASIKRISTSIEEAQAGLKFVREDSTHRIHQARESLKRMEADVKEAESQRDLARSDYERYSDLMGKGLVSKSEFDSVEARFKSSEARLDAAKKGRGEAKAALERAEASHLEVKAKEKEYNGLLDERERVKASYETAKNQMDEAAARVKEIEAAFKDTELRAPSSGTVINKLVEEGEMVAVGAPVATLIDLSDIYVKVYMPEKDIGKIRLGNPARIYADAFPGRSFDGEVTEISQKAEFTPKEVHMKEERTKLVFGVKVGIKNPEGYLKPGMPVDVKIKWMEEAAW